MSASLLRTKQRREIKLSAFKSNYLRACLILRSSNYASSHEFSLAHHIGLHGQLSIIFSVE